MTVTIVFIGFSARMMACGYEFGGSRCVNMVFDTQIAD